MFGRRKESILIIKIDGLRGFIAAEPLFETLRDRFSEADISLLTLPGLRQIAQVSPYFDRIATLPDMTNSADRKAFAKRLATAKFTKVYDLSNNKHSRKIRASFRPFGPKCEVADAPEKRPRNAPPTRSLPSFENLSASLGMDEHTRLPDLDWALTARRDSANMSPSWFGISNAYGLLAPGLVAEQRWPASHYSELSSLCLQAGITPVLIGPKEIHSIGDEICERVPEVVDLIGKTDYLQVIALAHEAGFFVSDMADEADLCIAVGASGVLIHSENDANAPDLKGDVMRITAKDAKIDEVDARYVWQYLNNMGLISADRAQNAASR